MSKMMRSTFVVGSILTLLVPVVASAAIVEYTDRTAWTTAIGGSADYSEDFSGFASDTPFRPEGTTVSVSMGTLGQEGTDENFRNFVDVAPFLFTDNNGTSHASCFVNSPEGSNPEGTTVRLAFTEPMSAFGADFNGTLGGELLVIDVVDVDGTTVLGTLGPPPSQNSFLGFVADAGERAGSVVLRSQNLSPGGAGKGFGMDNLASVVQAQADLVLTKEVITAGP
ncbi:MAG: hypothetical protein R3324_12080, partial [Halobacteriales archaeon]|nr:hypothetical protein [Halobacteriales archaeon]